MNEWFALLSWFTPAALYVVTGVWFFIPRYVRRKIQARFDAYTKGSEPIQAEVDRWRMIAVNQGLCILPIWPVNLLYHAAIHPGVERIERVLHARTVSDGEYDWRQRQEIERLDRELERSRREKQIGEAHRELAQIKGLTIDELKAGEKRFTPTRGCDCSQRGWHHHPGRGDLWFYNKHDF